MIRGWVMSFLVLLPPCDHLREALVVASAINDESAFERGEVDGTALFSNNTDRIYRTHR